MAYREKLYELIFEMGKDGKEIHIAEIAKIDGLVDEVILTERAKRNAAYQKARMMVRNVFESQGMTVRSVKKNVYKVVDETSPADCVAELNRLTKLANKALRKRNEFRDRMIKNGIPVQMEVVELVLEGGDAHVQNSRKTQVRPVSAASKESKKAVANG